MDSSLSKANETKLVAPEWECSRCGRVNIDEQCNCGLRYGLRRAANRKTDYSAPPTGYSREEISGLLLNLIGGHLFELRKQIPDIAKAVDQCTRSPPPASLAQRNPITLGNGHDTHSENAQGPGTTHVPTLFHDQPMVQPVHTPSPHRIDYDDRFVAAVIILFRHSLNMDDGNLFLTMDDSKKDILYFYNPILVHALKEVDFKLRASQRDVESWFMPYRPSHRLDRRDVVPLSHRLRVRALKSSRSNDIMRRYLSITVDDLVSLAAQFHSTHANMVKWLLQIDAKRLLANTAPHEQLFPDASVQSLFTPLRHRALDAEVPGEIYRSLFAKGREYTHLYTNEQITIIESILSSGKPYRIGHSGIAYLSETQHIR